jgi:hypothetical protein
MFHSALRRGFAILLSRNSRNRVTVSGDFHDPVARYRRTLVHLSNDVGISKGWRIQFVRPA